MRATRAVIHIDHFLHNLGQVRKLAGPDRKICIAVKADGYGHGAVELSKAVLPLVDFLAVSTVDEAKALENLGKPVILLGLAEPSEIQDLVGMDLHPFVMDEPSLLKLSDEAVRQNRIIGVHLKVDTGMHRLGCSIDEAPQLASLITGASLPGVRLEGTCTHFPDADGSDPDFTTTQIIRFRAVVDSLRKAGIDPGIIHAANSAAILSRPEAHFDMVRPGIMLYGYYPSHEMIRPVELKPVMEFKSQITVIRVVTAGEGVSYSLTWKDEGDRWIAAVSAGYADGYNRLLSSDHQISRGEVLIRGRRYPVAGRVCMDQFLVDLGPVRNGQWHEIKAPAEVGDEIILFGPDPAGFNAETIGDLTGTISYEVTCGVSRRVPRVFVHEI